MLFVVPFVWPSAGPAYPSVALSFPAPVSPAISHTATASTSSGIQLQLCISGGSSGREPMIAPARIIGGIASAGFHSLVLTVFDGVIWLMRRMVVLAPELATAVSMMRSQTNLARA